MTKVPEKINLSQIIKETADQYGCYRTEAKGLIDEFLKVVLDHLADGKSVDLSPIGVLYTTPAKRPAADGRYRIIPKLRPAPTAKKILSTDKD